MMQDSKEDENIDELDDGFESEQENSNAFTIRDALQPPAAESFTTKELHSGFKFAPLHPQNAR
jgi:hypothetical protein